jgi:hypothetical protein
VICFLFLDCAQPLIPEEFCALLTASHQQHHFSDCPTSSCPPFLPSVLLSPYLHSFPTTEYTSLK